MKAMINNFYMPTRVVYGCNAISQLPSIITEYGLEACIIVCGSHFKSSAEDLRKTCPQIKGIYSEIQADASVQRVNDIVSVAKEYRADCIIAIGGGSVIDTSKMSSAIVNSKLKAEEFFFGAGIPQDGITLIAVPTTSGTGSEMSKAAVITVNGEKKTLFSDGFRARVAIIDPELTVSLSPRTTMITGLDAVTHAIESFWNLNHQPISDIYAQKSLSYSLKYLERAFTNGEDIEARSGMANASMMAGIAFSQTKNAGVHACSYPLTELFKMPHGEACAFTLSSFVELNADSRLEKLCTSIGLFGTAELSERIKKYQRMANLHMRLGEFGEVDIEKLAEECLNQPLMKLNPVPVEKKTLLEMFTTLS